METELRSQLTQPKYQHIAAKNEEGEFVGFINLSLRTDYVQGASTSPVGYIEGIYVKPEYRNKGVARELVAQAEKWAKDCGCSAIGSDTELHNAESQKFHKNAGFSEADIIVHFIRNIG